MTISDAHIWIGRFDSIERWNGYIDERDTAADGAHALNGFAADQGVAFYDHDWIEYNVIGADGDESPSTVERVAALLETFSYWESYAAEVATDAVAAAIEAPNVIVGIDVDEIEDPRSVSGDGYELRYLGTYRRSKPMPALDISVTRLNLADQRLTEIPAEVFEMVHLTELALGGNDLTTIPDDISRLAALEEIALNDNRLTALPSAMFELPNLRKISVARNRISNLPVAIGSAGALQSLGLSENMLTSLPDDVGDLRALRLLDVSNNQLRELPSSIGRLRSLTTLRLRRNPIDRLPDEITDLTITQQLALPKGFDPEAQSQAVRAWLAER